MREDIMAIITFKFHIPSNNMNTNPFMGQNNNFNFMPMNNFSIFNPFSMINFNNFVAPQNNNFINNPYVGNPSPSIGDTFVRQAQPAKTQQRNNNVTTAKTSQNATTTPSRKTGKSVNILDKSAGNPYLGQYGNREASVKYAQAFVGVINNREQGNARFSPDKYKEYNAKGQKWHWCADFVSTLIKDSYAGIKFNKVSTVTELKKWGIKNQGYMELPATGKNEFIAQNVKPGDIMISDGHTAIVESVNADGTFTTIDGNSIGGGVYRNKNRNAEVKKAGVKTVLGFISMDKIQAYQNA